MNRWYVVRTHAKAEAKAAWHLRNQGFAVYLPQHLKRRRHARRVERVRAPLFPRYLFVDMDLARTRWRAVCSTIGVCDLVRMGEAPAPVPSGIVEEIQGREDADGLVVTGDDVPFERGEVVRIRSGAFADHAALFECASDEDRITLLLDLLGRQVRVRMPLDAVTAYA